MKKAKPVNPARVAARQARRADILAAARAVFFEEGYQTASMDRIAARAKLTKRTVYAYFDSKHALFTAVIAEACAAVAAGLPTPEDFSGDPVRRLAPALKRTRALMLSADSIRLERVVAAEAERHPEFARALAQAFAASEAVLSRALAVWVSGDWLRHHDTAAFARMLNDLVACAPSFRGLLAEDPEAPDLLGESALDETVRLYLSAYGRI